MENNNQNNDWVSRDTVRVLNKLTEIDTRLELVIKRLDEKIVEQSSRISAQSSEIHQIATRLDELESHKDYWKGKISVYAIILSTLTSAVTAFLVKYFLEN